MTWGSGVEGYMTTARSHCMECMAAWLHAQQLTPRLSRVPRQSSESPRSSPGASKRSLAWADVVRAAPRSPITPVPTDTPSEAGTYRWIDDGITTMGSPLHTPPRNVCRRRALIRGSGNQGGRGGKEGRGKRGRWRLFAVWTTEGSGRRRGGGEEWERSGTGLSLF